MGCYCAEREKNRAVAESMKDIPPGFCGLCDICGRPGHTRAHPSLPTSGAWCDEHWEALLARPPLTPDRILFFVIIVLVIAGLGLALVRTVF